MTTLDPEVRRVAGRRGGAALRERHHEARGPVRDALRAIMSDLRPHRWRTIWPKTGATIYVARAAMVDLQAAGEVVQLAHGFWASSKRPATATAAPASPRRKWGYSDNLPISRRDPNMLTRGETLAFDHLCEWLEVYQAITVAALEGLSARLQADTKCSREEADALIEEWMKALIDKGRIDVRGPLIRIQADRLGRPVLLRLVEAGSKDEDVDENDEDDDEESDA